MSRSSVRLRRMARCINAPHTLFIIQLPNGEPFNHLSGLNCKYRKQRQCGDTHQRRTDHCTALQQLSDSQKHENYGYKCQYDSQQAQPPTLNLFSVMMRNQRFPSQPLIYLRNRKISSGIVIADTELTTSGGNILSFAAPHRYGKGRSVQLLQKSVQLSFRRRAIG